MKTVLVIGASGFIGRQLSNALLAAGYAVRCLAREVAKVEDLARAGCEVMPGDISDLAAVQRAVAAVEAVYISIHTLSAQPGSAANQRFMDIEKTGVQNVITACRAGGVRRVVYITSLGTSPEAPSEWLRERWHTEQLLLTSGLDATVIRPGFIVGVGGGGFDGVVNQARLPVGSRMGGDRPRMRTIAVDDLVYYLVGVLDDPRTYGQGYDVGNDYVLSIKQLIETIAAMLARRPALLPPPTPASPPAPAPERRGSPPEGAMEGFRDSLQVDMNGDPLPIRTLLPRPLRSWPAAAEHALASN
ncbi:SDR family oxidoreductase [Hymenobacter sp. PAMC 26628]|uniref:SDR family oxidoreductase n=1 Tax=Hymenobacter sp. PAMC 26628 TaxID=1484118 RepID=UPI000770664E|nr:SDR family NAD(P)-dependent oxidoreductase [Hymenobacter sp. PAMC 26628]AMJ67814.1 hypothetical protein AXW84_22100 [Hymenobacter sp. PAMC 26628]